ncbi:MAG: hypothetical protein KC620_24965, partial [Myxococcales bacterium]|nr:hypothetical protein [Myxococcales bacterium]
SMWTPRPIAWTPQQRAHDPAVQAVMADPHAKLFQWFAMDQLVAITSPDHAGTTVELHDFRYGFAQTPDRALWGVRAHVASDGTLDHPVERFRAPMPPDVTQVLSEMWRATFPR